MERIAARFAVLGIFWLATGVAFGQGRNKPTANDALPAILPTSQAFGDNAESGGRGEGEARRDEIETDRDSFTPATTTTGRRRLIVESAYSFFDNRQAKDDHSFPELLLRYGVTDRLEFRFGWNYEIGGVDRPPFDELERASNLSYGMKFRVSENEEWKPGSAIILQAFTPTSGEVNSTQVIATYVLGWELPNCWKLDASMRYGTGTEFDDHFNEWAPSVVLKVPLWERVNVHAEYFGLFSTNKAEEFNYQFFSPGIHYLISDNFEIGVRAGWGMNDQSARFFSNVGLGLRF